jgi:hypothetical protein
MAPTAPRAPASVAVATPVKMLPNTTRMSSKGGTRAFMTWASKALPRAVRSWAGSAGAWCGCNQATAPA